MKLVHALTCVIILSLTFANYSEAKGRSFGGGFGSQRTTSVYRPAPRPSMPQAAPTTQTKSMFGSFGAKPATSGGTATPQNTQSLNMSKDLNANAAQGNALKNVDGRNAAKDQSAAGGNNAGGSNTGWFRSGNSGASGAQPTGAMQSAQQPVVVRQGGGFMNNAMWFMLGSSMASHHQTTYIQNGNQNAGTGVNPADANDPNAIVAPPLEEKPSFFMSLLRIILWGAIFFGIYKLVKMFMQSKKNRESKKPNYTFGNH